jgi:hypothetical protein
MRVDGTTAVLALGVLEPVTVGVVDTGSARDELLPPVSVLCLFIGGSHRSEGIGGGAATVGWLSLSSSSSIPSTSASVIASLANAYSAHQLKSVSEDRWAEANQEHSRTIMQYVPG